MQIIIDQNNKNYRMEITLNSPIVLMRGKPSSLYLIPEPILLHQKLVYEQKK